MNTGKPTISAVLIVKNEAVLLPRCLESIKGVDEIIICDTGSLDTTLEVAKKFTDKVYTDFSWCDNFAKARNHALSKATGDWVLSIDADEYLHDFSKVEQVVVEADAKGFLAVNVKMIAEDTGHHFPFPRIFKRDPRVWWEGAIHNHLSIAGEDMGEVAITHGYSPAHVLDPDRAYRILSKVVAETGNGRERYYLGREEWYKGKFEEAVETMKKYIETSKFQSERADAYLIMAKSYWALGKGDEARDACAQALIINSHFKEAALLMSEIVFPEYSGQWQKMAETANNSNVLFVRN